MPDEWVGGSASASAASASSVSASAAASVSKLHSNNNGVTNGDGGGEGGPRGGGPVTAAAARPPSSKKKKENLANSDEEEEDAHKMQTTDAMRVPGLSAELNQQITKFDSSEFDVSTDVPNWCRQGEKGEECKFLPFQFWPRWDLFNFARVARLSCSGHSTKRNVQPSNVIVLVTPGNFFFRNGSSENLLTFALGLVLEQHFCSAEGGCNFASLCKRPTNSWPRTAVILDANEYKIKGP